MALASEFSRERLLVLVSLYTLFQFLTSGLIYGYNVLKLVLLDQKVYLSLCDDPAATKCDAQVLRMDTMFTVASTLTNVSGFLAGLLLDRFGPRLTNSVGAVIIALGLTLFGVSQRTGIDGYIAGFALLSIGGPVVYFSSFHLANTFPRRSGLILAFFSVGFDCSSAIFFIFEKAYFASGGAVSIERWFLFYLIVPAIEMLAGLTLMPRSVFRLTTDRSHKRKVSDFKVHPGAGEKEVDVRAPSMGNADAHEDAPSSASAEAIALHTLAPDAAAESQQVLHASTDERPHAGRFAALNLHSLSLKAQYGSPQFYLVCAFLCIIVLQMNTYIGTVYNQLAAMEGIVGGDEFSGGSQSSQMSSHFGFILPLGGLVSIPAVGYVLDHHRFSVSVMLVTGMSLLYSVLAMIPSLKLQYLTMILVTVNRALLWAFSAHFFAAVFGSRTFGKVYGLANLSVGAVGAVQYAYNAYGLGTTDAAARERRWRTVNGINTALIAAVAIPTIYFYLRRWEVQRGQGSLSRQ